MYPAPDKTIRSFYVFSDDLSSPGLRRSYWLHLALQRLGIRSFWRDTTDVRNTLNILKEKSLAKHYDVQSFIIGTKLTEMAMFGWIDAVISPDCDWFFPNTRFTENDGIKASVSLWDSELLAPLRRCGLSSIPDDLFAKKCHHFLPSPARMKEAQSLNFPNIHFLPHASPAEYLDMGSPASIADKLIYIGSPDFPSPPDKDSLSRLPNASIEEMRQMAILEIQKELPETWLKEYPDASRILEDACHAKASSPHQSSLALLKTSFEKLSTSHDNKSSTFLEMAERVSSVLKYDQPLILRHLQKRNLVDVYGDFQTWVNYGITSQSAPRWHQIPQLISQYPAHLNLSNSRTETELSENFFIAGALGKASFGLKIPDIDFLEDHFLASGQIPALASSIEEYLHSPKNLEQAGNQTKEWIRSKHTLDHRMKQVLEALTT